MRTHTQSMKTALMIATAADDVMLNLGQRTTDAVCQAVRSALDKLWNIMATREAAVALKDVPVGKTVKCEWLLRVYYQNCFGITFYCVRFSQQSPHSSSDCQFLRLWC